MFYIITVVFGNAHQHLASFMLLTVRKRPWKGFRFDVCMYRFHLHHHSVSGPECNKCQPKYINLICIVYHTHTYVQFKVGTMSREWWSPGMKGWGIRNCLVWWIKGLHDNQARTFCFTGTFFKWTSRQIRHDVCACERNRSAPKIDRVQYLEWCVFFISGQSVCLCLHHIFPFVSKYKYTHVYPSTFDMQNCLFGIIWRSMYFAGQLDMFLTSH